MATKEVASLLLLPDPCLVAVLQHCGGDLISLFSAARAHSRLHQAALLALSSISVANARQEQVDGLVQYLSEHGRQLNSVEVMNVRERRSAGSKVLLRRLPPNLQVDRLNLTGICLQLLPGCLAGSFSQPAQGVVRSGLPQKQLRLHDCTLLDGKQGLAAALGLLPELQHLSITHTPALIFTGHPCSFPTAVLNGLQQLTYLELLVCLEGPDQQPVMQPLQALTRLAHLRVAPLYSSGRLTIIDNSILTGMRHLTRLEVSKGVEFEPDALAGKTRLQHLVLDRCIAGAAAGASQVLVQLPQLQQLTHLELAGCFKAEHEGNPPAAAFSALTAGSKLQHLDISGCTLPAAAWQHVFPVARQLPHLRSLHIRCVRPTDGSFSGAPDSSRLVSCCPGLQSLDMHFIQRSAEPLSPLQGLGALRTLRVSATQGYEELLAVGQLTRLREVDLTAFAPGSAEVLLPQLAQLKELTALSFLGRLSSGDPRVMSVKHKVGFQTRA
jgi:hypothetical protein